MFTVEERDRLRERLLTRAEADDSVVGAAFTLVRSLTAAELHRALSATVAVVTAELKASRPELAARLVPMFAELTNTPPAKCR